MPAGADRLPGWADAVAAFPAEIFFDEAVLQRVERDDRQPPGGLEGCHRLWKDFLDPVQLLVHCDAQGLEGPRGGVDVTPTGQD